MRVGIEVGGTFTDLIALDGAEVRVAKVPSVPRSPEDGAFAALAAARIPIDRVTDLVHGSTVATNAVLERKGALTALVTTAGFGDLLLIQRQDRERVFQLAYRKPAAVIERRDVIEVEERMLADGTAAVPLDVDGAARRVLEALAARAYRSVAVCLLNAYANPAHELAIAQRIRAAFPALHVSCSHEVSREFREYERASTTALSAYVQPIIDSYLGRFEERLAREGFRGRFSVMQSNGGRLPAAAIRGNAISALFSGPAAGVTGAIRQVAAAGRANLITFDMGGTSTDVCLVTGGAPVIAAETRVDGLPIRTPVVDIATVGAGGGSIVWLDPGGMLRVGPRSAGADPGPACYGRGGTAPTVTDAHLIRGTIRADAFLGGRMTLDEAAARAAFGPLSEALGLPVERVADSTVRLADANVVRAIQLISTELGRDPRDYVLVPFGGAGPLHAGRIAEDLGIATIVVPQNAGVLSAFGLLASEYTVYETATHRMPLDAAAPAAVRDTLARMRTTLESRLREAGLTGATRHEHVLQMRYVGQAFEVEVRLDDDDLERLSVELLASRFEEANRRIYMQGGGAGLAGRNVEFVGFRAGAAASEHCPLPPRAEGGPPREVPVRRVRENRADRDCAVLTRPAIRVRGGAHGPLLVEDETATIYVPPGWRAAEDAAGNLILEREATA
jgi:N-methylhydantoinase A